MTVEPTPKKKIRPLWVVLGLAGACAACCAVPIVLLLLGGATLAAAGAALNQSWDAIACGALMLIVLVAVLVLMRPKRPAPSCSVDGACGCKEKA
ncbi:MAG: hypothetical protein B7Z42_06145 [Brevundimonas sp. 12-68-7]|uniref:Mercuric ion transport protein n=1 Tax=Brevundimonas subvibrioides TaxID=74313 RepID=A0A258FFK4_9CAUL|nr:MAG: hypothetical protein B7Z42_06145 [Brevundimonas sp. 12-68-7]OYX31315.1 MAG: hypothetical protein B7Z01_12820 [Brevundimonas subvibrioides]